MRNNPPPGSRRVGDWLDMRVRTKTELRNGYAVVPAGSTGTIDGITPGLSILFDACPCCGVKVRMSRLSSNDVELSGTSTQQENKDEHEPI